MSDQLGGDTVLVEFEDGIAWVTLNRPEKRNAMNPALNNAMLAVLEALEVDERCGVLVLTGAGDSFSAGMDLKEFFRASDPLTPEVRAQFTRMDCPPSGPPIRTTGLLSPLIQLRNLLTK